MSLCGVTHPDRPLVTCDRPRPTTGHRKHTGVVIVDHRPEHVDWPNEDYVPPVEKKPGSKRARITALADQVRAENDPAPRLSGTDANSREAARVYIRDGSRTTRLDQVAKKLLNNVGCWIDSSALQTTEIGGLAGSRRMRELRDDYGWRIETRRDPSRTGIWQHRLIEIPDLERGHG